MLVDRADERVADLREQDHYLPRVAVLLRLCEDDLEEVQDLLVC